jgi:hypothetical protein
MIDRRGVGLSDRLSPEDLPPIEQLVDDIGVVSDAVGSERVVIFGTSDGGAIQPRNRTNLYASRIAGSIACHTNGTTLG